MQLRQFELGFLSEMSTNYSLLSVYSAFNIQAFTGKKKIIFTC